MPSLDANPIPDRTQWALNIVPIIFFGVGGAMAVVHRRSKNRKESHAELESQEEKESPEEAENQEEAGS